MECITFSIYYLIMLVIFIIKKENVCIEKFE